MMEFLRWFFSTVIFGMLPIYLKLLYGLSRKVKEIGFVWLFASGELLLISTVIGCNAIGKVFNVKTSHPILGTISPLMCLLLVVLSSAWFADVSVARRNAKANERMVSYGSTILFSLNLLASCCCVYSVIF